MLRQLVKTMKTWEKAKKQLKFNHARFQILNFCLRTRFHHFCRGIRPSKMSGPVRPTVEYLSKREPKEYAHIRTSTPEQSVVELIDNWFWDQALEITGRFNVNMLQREDKLRFTFPRRKGGMGFSLLSDIQPGAFTAAFFECLYPRGLDKHADPRSGDIGLREICPDRKGDTVPLEGNSKRPSDPIDVYN
jgi:hypothetical protein